MNQGSKDDEEAFEWGLNERKRYHNVDETEINRLSGPMEEMDDVFLIQFTMLAQRHGTVGMWNFNDPKHLIRDPKLKAECLSNYCLDWMAILFLWRERK